MGDARFLVTANLTGTIFSAGAVASGVLLFHSGEITKPVLAWGVLFATISSMFVKLIFVSTSGSGKFKVRYTGTATLIAVVGAAVLYIMTELYTTGLF